MTYVSSTTNKPSNSVPVNRRYLYVSFVGVFCNTDDPYRCWYSRGHDTYGGFPIEPFVRTHYHRNKLPRAKNERRRRHLREFHQSRNANRTNTLRGGAVSRVLFHYRSIDTSVVLSVISPGRTQFLPTNRGRANDFDTFRGQTRGKNRSERRYETYVTDGRSDDLLRDDLVRRKLDKLAGLGTR